MGRGEGALQRTERRILVFAGWVRGRHRPHTLLLTHKNSGQAGGWGGGRQPPSSRLCLSRSARLATQAICRKPAMAMAVIARFPPWSAVQGFETALPFRRAVTASAYRLRKIVKVGLGQGGVRLNGLQGDTFKFWLKPLRPDLEASGWRPVPT